MNQIRHGTNSTCIRCTVDRRLIIKSNGQSGFEYIQRELEPDFNLVEDYPIEKLNIILRFDEKTEKIQEVTFNKDQMDIKTTFGIGQFWTKNYQDRFHFFSEFETDTRYDFWSKQFFPGPKILPPRNCAVLGMRK